VFILAGMGRKLPRQELTNFAGVVWTCVESGAANFCCIELCYHSRRGGSQHTLLKNSIASGHDFLQEKIGLSDRCRIDDLTREKW